MSIEKRPKTGLHGSYKDPVQLKQWLAEFGIIQVQVTTPQEIYRGMASRYDIEKCSKTGYIIVVFESLYVGNHPKKKDVPILWSEFIRPSYRTEKARVRENFKWVQKPESGEEKNLPEPTEMRMFYSSYYLTRENRIKIKGSGECWRFFRADDPTNLILNEDGTVTQKATII